MITKKVILFTSMLVLSASSVAQPSYQATIEDTKSQAIELIKKNEASALSIALVGPQGIIWNESFGLADPTTGQAVTESTLFGIGSVSKLIAAIAVMKLVDKGLVELDTPFVNYLPTFRMLSPEYKNITVRMLLNHSAGFPGSDYRNLLTRSPYPGYLNQALQTLSQSRLKTPPGFMNVYCNDCFTMLEALVLARTGKNYTQFVQEEILTPLEMTNTRYPTSFFPADSYVRVSVDGLLKPQEVVNSFASGGAYSTTKDLARIVQMLLNEGAVAGKTAMLSTQSVAEMAKDQTLGTFNPVRFTSFAYGLGWDTVTQPGLLAVGFDGWAKGGDTLDYGSILMVSPKAQLGVVVLGATKFGSEKAKVIAERLVLHALAENKLIPSVPLPLPPPSVIPAIGNIPYPNQEYALFDLVLNFKKQNETSVSASILADSGWSPLVDLEPQADGWFISPPVTELKVIEASVLGKKHEYLIKRTPIGYGHYLDTSVMAQKLEGASKKLSAAWKARLHKTWLVVNAHADELTWSGLDPRLRLSLVPGSTQLIAVRPPEDGKFHVLNPTTSDTRATMMLTIPQLNGRDLHDLVVVKRQGKEWMRYGSYLHQPLSSVPVLPLNKATKVNIDSHGYAKWQAIKSQAFKVQLTINTEGEWLVYDNAFKLLHKGKGKAVVTIAAGKGLNYLTLFGEPRKSITLVAKKVRE